MDEEDCTRVKERMLSTTNYSVDHDAPVIDKVLTYVMITLQKYPPLIVKHQILAHYDKSAIEQAKDALWNHPAAGSMCGKKIDRRDSPARTAEEANAEDITMACMKLMKQETQLPLIAASAMDILQMPMFEGAQEGGTQFRISCLENDLHQMKEAFKALSEEMKSMKCSQNARNEGSPSCAEVLMRPRTNRLIDVPVQSSNSSTQPTHDGESTTTTAVPSGDALEGSGEFEVPPHVRRKQRQNERRKRKKKIVVGTCASSESGLRGAAGGAKNLFISRVARDDDAEEKLRKLLTSQHCSTFHLKETSHQEALFLSYRLTIPACDVDKVFSELFPWPEGINVSWWRNKPKHDQK